MAIQDAVLRLERAGSDSSKTTRKLREAVIATASKIAEILASADLECDCTPVGRDGMIYLNLRPETFADFGKLPDSEKAKWGGIGSYYYDPKNGLLWTGCAEEDGEVLNPGYRQGVAISDVIAGNLNSPSRENCLMFARHVANGLLGLVAEWLEKRTATDIRAIARLEKN